MNRAEAQPRQSVAGKLQGLALAAVQYARTRIDLLQFEVRQEQSRLGGLLARAALFGLGALATYQLLAALIVAAFWNTPWRLYAIGGVALLTAAISYGAWRSLKASAEASSRPFRTTVEEFDKDRAAILALAGERPAATPPQATATAAAAAGRSPAATDAARRQAAAAMAAEPGLQPPPRANGGADAAPKERPHHAN